MFVQRPALRFVIIFAAGILLSEYLPTAPIWLLLILLLFVILTLSLFKLSNSHLTVAVLLCISILLSGSFFHAIQHSEFNSAKLEPIIPDEPVRITGVIDTEPSIQERRVTCIVSTDSIAGFRRIIKEPRRVMITLHLNYGELVPGNFRFREKIKLAGIIEQFPFQRNPGEFNYGKYLELNNIQGVVYVHGLRDLQLYENRENNIFKTWINSAQITLFNIIDSLHSHQHAGFLKGIIFGYRTEIHPDVKQAFLDTGTIHILAVSGSNVAFVAFIFFSLFGFFRMSRRMISGVAILGLVVYMLLTGSSPSVVRATIMIIIILCGILFERKTEVYNSIAFAALILLLWNTNTLFDIGFQLSFSAVVSIVWFYPRIVSLNKYLPDKLKNIKVIDGGFKLFAVSLAAQIGTIPLTAYYFGRLSLISFVANIPVVPISGINTFIGAAEIMIYPISSTVAHLYAAANDFLVWFLLGFVKLAANVPFAVIGTWRFPAAFAVVYYATVVCLFNFYSPKFRALLIIIILIISNFFLFKNIWRDFHPELTATVIDIGQGDAVLLEFPNKKKMLVDTGPSSKKFDAGDRIIVPLLKYKGIRDLDYLLITHPHSDHIGGAPSILKSIKIDTLFIADLSPDNVQAKEIVQIAQERSVAVKEIFAGDQIRIDPDTRVYVLYPNRNLNTGNNPNSSSIVLKIQFGKYSLLLTGDSEYNAEKELILRYSSFLSTDILKVGHHGSKTSTTDQFLNYTHPAKAIISAGVHNQFHNPSPLTISRLKSRSIEIHRTDRSGAVIFENDGTGWINTHWR